MKRIIVLFALWALPNLCTAFTWPIPDTDPQHYPQPSVAVAYCDFRGKDAQVPLHLGIDIPHQCPMD